MDEWELVRGDSHHLGEPKRVRVRVKVLQIKARARRVGS